MRPLSRRQQRNNHHIDRVRRRLVLFQIISFPMALAVGDFLGYLTTGHSWILDLLARFF